MFPSRPVVPVFVRVLSSLRLLTSALACVSAQRHADVMRCAAAEVLLSKTFVDVATTVASRQQVREIHRPEDDSFLDVELEFVKF